MLPTEYLLVDVALAESLLECRRGNAISVLGESGSRYSFHFVPDRSPYAWVRSNGIFESRPAIKVLVKLWVCIE